MTKDAGETIDPGVATPIWRQLAAILRARILTGRYTPGHAIASETQLQQEFGIARNTARRSIALLRDEGLVVTVPGRGTYVVSAEELQQHRPE